MKKYFCPVSLTSEANQELSGPSYLSVVYNYCSEFDLSISIFKGVKAVNKWGSNFQ